MIHTLTLNPAMDLSFVVDGIPTDGVARAKTVWREPSGKGVNVSKVVHRLGHPTLALGFVAGRTGLELEDLLTLEGVPSWFTRVQGETRTNPTIQSPERDIHITTPGPNVTDADLERLTMSLFALRKPDWLVIAGSSPPGTPTDFVPKLIARAQREGIKVALDADGAALEAGVRAGAALVKPNRHELERFVGREVRGVDDVLAAAGSVLEAGAQTVVVSLGAEGAVLVTRELVVQAIPPTITANGTVGAGDSLLAGLCVQLAEGSSALEALRFGVACGTATAIRTGSSLCELADVQAMLSQVKAMELI